MSYDLVYIIWKNTERSMNEWMNVSLYCRGEIHIKCYTNKRTTTTYLAKKKKTTKSIYKSRKLVFPVIIPSEHLLAWRSDLPQPPLKPTRFCTLTGQYWVSVLTELTPSCVQGSACVLLAGIRMLGLTSFLRERHAWLRITSTELFSMYLDVT